MTNSASIIMYKSSRKNAVTSDIITIHHLINKDNPIISDSRILEHFASTLDKIVHESKKYNGFIEFTTFVNTSKSLQYHTGAQRFGIDSTYQLNVNVPYKFSRQRYYSLETAIEFLHTVFLLIYPYSKLSIEDIHANASIRYIIGEYYKA